MDDITTGRIKLASAQTRQYLRESNLKECRIEVLRYERETDTLTLTITFNGNMSSQNLMDITKIWFWNLPTAPMSLTNYTPETNTLEVTLKHCAASSKVYAKLIELGAEVHSFSADPTAFTFEASPKGRVDFLSEALDEIRSIVDPSHIEDFSVYQVVKANTTHLRIYPTYYSK